jgi:23S rRNA (cytosine1962-C5)-methyltransferase
MDPPAFGHGPSGQMWKFNKDFPKLFELCMQVLSDKPLFILTNAYAISSSHLMLKNVFEDFLGKSGIINSGELTLEESINKRLLSTGIFATWSA